MDKPTKEQLSDPAWWDKAGQPNATHYDLLADLFCNINGYWKSCVRWTDYSNQNGWGTDRYVERPQKNRHHLSASGDAVPEPVRESLINGLASARLAQMKQFTPYQAQAIATWLIDNGHVKGE